MNQEELKDYIDELNAFNAMLKEHFYQNKNVKAKNLHFREMYSKSMIASR